MSAVSLKKMLIEPGGSAAQMLDAEPLERHCRKMTRSIGICPLIEIIG